MVKQKNILLDGKLSDRPLALLPIGDFWANMYLFLLFDNSSSAEKRYDSSVDKKSQTKFQGIVVFTNVPLL